MKIEVRNRENESQYPYPYIGIFTRKGKHLIVLFKCKNSGTVLKADCSWNVGDYTESWDESSFSPLPSDKEVTLSNK